MTDVCVRAECVAWAVWMEVSTRAIRGWHLSRHLEQTLTLTALRQALAQHRSEIHHSDQGVQYAATAYIQLLQDVGAQLSIAAVGEATENGYAERLMRTIKEEDFHDAYQHLGRSLADACQHKRIHSALGYRAPAKFETQSQLLTTAASLKLEPP